MIESQRDDEVKRLREALENLDAVLYSIKDAFVIDADYRGGTCDTLYHLNYGFRFIKETLGLDFKSRSLRDCDMPDKQQRKALERAIVELRSFKVRHADSIAELCEQALSTKEVI